MSKCRYDLSEDCNNKDCVKCVLDKIRAEIKHYNLRPSNYPCNMISIDAVLQIIDKYKTESEK